MINLKSPREIEHMRQSGRLAAETLQHIAPWVQAGVSTEELNRECHKFITQHGAIPSPLNYHGFPKSICTSVNNVICHGIPSPHQILKEGDILNIDVTVFYEGFHGDTNKTFLIGQVDPAVQQLVKVTYDAMWAGIRAVKPNAHLNDIALAIAQVVRPYKYGIVEDYCGHGIGRNFHEDPQVIHAPQRRPGPKLLPGMVFTIEPMINLGSPETQVLADDWTVITTDHRPSAQFEHTLAVTEDGFEVLTLLADGREP